MAETRTDLGKIFITNGGVYNPEATYEKLTMISYNNSTYITLRTITGVTPTDDRINYLLMAQGFTASYLASVTAVDQQGLVTGSDPGDEVDAQLLINAIADRVANQLVTNTALATRLQDYILKSAITQSMNITEEGYVGDARGFKTLNDAFAYLSYPTKKLQNVNLNSCITTGVYRLSGSITNSPSGNYGVLVVFGVTDSTVRQIMFVDTDASFYTRVKTSSGWTNWVKNVDGDTLNGVTFSCTFTNGVGATTIAGSRTLIPVRCVTANSYRVAARVTGNGTWGIWLLNDAGTVASVSGTHEILAVVFP